MNTIFVNFKNSKTSDSRRPLLNLLDKRNSERSDTYVALCCSICCTEKYKAPPWNEKFELRDGSLSIFVTDHFLY